jgi:ABC-2 type transport system ATP-binding protein
LTDEDSPEEPEVLRTEGLVKKFGALAAVDNLNLSVRRGEIFGLVGPDGAGKTTTLRLLASLLDPTSGFASVLGHDTAGEAETIKESVGYMSQRFGLYPDLTVFENMDFYADIYGVPRKGRAEKIDGLLSFSHLTPFKKRHAENLSGGMKQKLGLACALLNNPRVLLLDEPTNGVDPVSRRDFWRILYRLLREKVTILLATSYMDEAERCVRIGLMHEGKLLAIGTPREVKEAVLGKFEVEPGLEEVFVSVLTGGGEKESVTATPPAEKIFGETAVSVEKISKTFGEFTAVDRVSFEVARGEIFGFLGPNGAGKSTTIRMLCGLISPSGGRGTVAGLDISTQAELIKTKIGYMSQRFSLYEELTVEENLDFFSGIYRIPAAKKRERKAWVIEMAGLEGHTRTPAGALAGGWKQRLALGCAILHEPPIVFLDEPTSGVDPLRRRSFWKLIRNLSEGGTTVFVTTHHMDEAEYCDRLGLIYRGELIALGSPAALKREKMEDKVLEICCARPAETMAALEGLPQIKDLALFGSGFHAVVGDLDKAREAISRRLSENAIPVGDIRQVEPSLEDLFISLIEARDLADGKVSEVAG